MSCQMCGAPISSADSRRRYCSDVCRKRKQRQGPPPDAMQGPGVRDATREVLESAGKAETPQGRTALVLAWKIDSLTASGAELARLSQELDRIVGTLTADHAVEADELDGFQADVIQMRSRRA